MLQPFVAHAIPFQSIEIQWEKATGDNRSEVDSVHASYSAIQTLRFKHGSG